MALNIKDEPTDRLVRRYARLKQTSYTKAIKLAISDALEREGEIVESEQARDFLDHIHRLQAKMRALPVLDDRSADEIIGYDEYGLPA